MNRPGPGSKPDEDDGDLSVDALEEGVKRRDRAALGRTITLLESRAPRHRVRAQQLLSRLLPRSGDAIRVGVTGSPGVGKSTLIEALGKRLTGQGHRVAVLAVDPSSKKTGGSLLGDKTRMVQLGADDEAFIRPSPSAGTLGGVASKTRETMILCEAAGYDVVLVETVGIGQSETVVAGMTDFFLVLLLPGSGDELQGIKKGLLELADLVAVNQADGANVAAAEVTARHYQSALDLKPARESAWRPRVVTCSALEDRGLEEIWTVVKEHREVLSGAGELTKKRERQRLDWLHSIVEEELLLRFRDHPEVKKTWKEMTDQVLAGTITPPVAAEAILGAFGLKGS